MLHFSAKSWFHIVDVYREVMILKSISIWLHGVSIFLASEKRVPKLKKRWTDFEGIDRLPKNAHPTLAFFVLEFTLVWKHWIGLHMYSISWHGHLLPLIITTHFRHYLIKAIDIYIYYISWSELKIFKLYFYC